MEGGKSINSDRQASKSARFALLLEEADKEVADVMNSNASDEVKAIALETINHKLQEAVSKLFS
jgi:hypothetical protein